MHQHWQAATIGKWRQDPEISGGGFLFDTGSQMVNTVVDLIGQDVVEVCALMDRCGTRVDINSTINGRCRDGSIWFYSKSSGVIRYRDSEWQHFTRDDGLGDNWVSVMCEADGAVWFATDRGLSRFDGATWTTLTEADGLADDEVHGALVSPSGIVWLATNSGVSQYNGLLWRRYGVADGLPDDLVRGIAEDVQGRYPLGCGALRWP